MCKSATGSFGMWHSRQFLAGLTGQAEACLTAGAVEPAGAPAVALGAPACEAWQPRHFAS